MSQIPALFVVPARILHLPMRSVMDDCNSPSVVDEFCHNPLGLLCSNAKINSGSRRKDSSSLSKAPDCPDSYPLYVSFPILVAGVAMNCFALLTLRPFLRLPILRDLSPSLMPDALPLPVDTLRALFQSGLICPRNASDSHQNNAHA